MRVQTAFGSSSAMVFTCGVCEARRLFIMDQKFKDAIVKARESGWKTGKKEICPSCRK